MITLQPLVTFGCFLFRGEGAIFREKEHSTYLIDTTILELDGQPSFPWHSRGDSL